MGEEDVFSRAVCVCVCVETQSARSQPHTDIVDVQKSDCDEKNCSDFISQSAPLPWHPFCCRAPPSARSSWRLRAHCSLMQNEIIWVHFYPSNKQTRAVSNVSNVSNVQSLFSLRGRERWVMGGPRQSDSGSVHDALLELSADFTLNALPLSITSAQSLPRFQKTSKNSFLCLLV